MSDQSERIAVETYLAASVDSWYDAAAVAAGTSLTEAKAGAHLANLTSNQRGESRQLTQYRRFHPNPPSAGWPPAPA